LISENISLTLATGNGQVLITPERERERERANSGELFAIRAVPPLVGEQSRREQRSLGYFNFQGFGGYAANETASTMKARDYKDATDLVVGQITPSSE